MIVCIVRCSFRLPSLVQRHKFYKVSIKRLKLISEGVGEYDMRGHHGLNRLTRLIEKPFVVFIYQGKGLIRCLVHDLAWFGA